MNKKDQNKVVGEKLMTQERILFSLVVLKIV